MPVEIDERQLSYLTNTAKAAEQMLRNPKTRAKALALYKEINPNAAVPELDTHMAMRQAYAAIDKKLTDFITEERTSRQNRETEETLNKIKAQVETGRNMLKSRGYTDEGIKKVEEFRDSKGLVDYDDAIKLYEVYNPPAQVIDHNGSMSMLDSVIHGQDDNTFHKELFDNRGEADWAVEREALATIREMRGAQRR